jgi:hypothetical protein
LNVGPGILFAITPLRGKFRRRLVAGVAASMPDVSSFFDGPDSDWAMRVPRLWRT